MKKFKKLLLVLVLCVSALTLTGCGNKKEITAEEFKNILTERNFVIHDVQQQFSSYSNVTDALVAKNDNYQIEFLAFTDEDGAKTSFLVNKTNFENAKGTVTTSQLSVTTDNYETYHLVSNGKYMHVTRVGKTIIYADVDSKFKGEVEGIIEDIGY